MITCLIVSVVIGRGMQYYIINETASCMRVYRLFACYEFNNTIWPCDIWPWIMMAGWVDSVLNRWPYSVLCAQTHCPSNSPMVFHQTASSTVGGPKMTCATVWPTSDPTRCGTHTISRINWSVTFAYAQKILNTNSQHSRIRFDTHSE